MPDRRKPRRAQSPWRSGRKAEDQVRDFLVERGNVLLKARWSSGFGEVDLLFRTARGLLLMVEVKTLADGQDPLGRVPYRQILRLKRIFQHLAENGECLAYVFFVRPGEEFRGEHFRGEIFWLPLAEF